MSATPELWIGLHYQARHYAKKFGVRRPRVVTEASQLEGFHGPLVIYLCGDYRELPDWPAISDTIERLKVQTHIQTIIHAR